ncbi:hypothetical protein BDR06DRAFT_1003013 [Suillus hirtellus]|nr:hypothetical protein BDR06DRAFT_1003013 [Suillus hirtellus]
MDSDKSDIDEEVELDLLNDEEFGKKLTEMVEREDGKDLDWITERLQRKTQKATSKCKHALVNEPAEQSNPSIILPHARSVLMMSDSTFVDDQDTTDSELDSNHAVHDDTTNENTNPLAEDILDEDDAEEWEQELDSTLASNTEICD